MLPGHSYWLSYNSCGAKNRALSGNVNACLISIVLDYDARDHFSAIRLVIVCRESIYLDDLRIVDCLEAYKYDGDNDTTYRAVLEQHRLNINSHAAPTLPACVITLEVVRDGIVTGYRLAPLPQPDPHEISGGQLRIAYDRTHPSTPSHPFFRTFLQSTFMLGSGYQSFYIGADASPCIVAYSFRLLPASRSRSETIELSSEIIRRIIEFAIETGPPYGQLLAYGLVCKAWTHVLDLFFERYHLPHFRVGDPHYYYPNQGQSDPIVVARCLQRRPDRAAFLRTLNMNVPDNEPITVATWEALLTILTLAKLIREMATYHIPPYVTKLILACFREMRDVRTWTLGTDDSSGRNHMTMDEIQTAIAGWEHLHTLRLNEWRNQDSSELHSPALVPGSTPIRLSCKIKTLCLSLGALSGPQLLRFAPPPTSYFQYISLQNITGPSNHDLFLLLSHAAPTLVMFHSAFCDFPTSNDHEERALDAAMPEMCALEDVSVHGNIATHLSIARKLPGKKTLQQPTTISIEYTDISEHSVAQALETTAWERVMVVWDPEGEDDLERDERLISIASKKGVVFRSEEVLYRYGIPVY